MDPCYQKKVCNCIKSNCCEQDYECCSQNVENGNQVLGLCVKKGMCDKTRGICVSRKSTSLPSHENFTISSIERYGSVDQKHIYLFVAIMIIILVLFGLKSYSKI